MPNVVPRRFSHPETFRKIRPDLLLAWLMSGQEYFVRHGVLQPHKERGTNGENGTDGTNGTYATVATAAGERRGTRIDYEALVRVFMEPTADMPAGLLDGLYLVHEMGRARHVNQMVEEARANGLILGIDESDTPMDIALKLLLQDQRFLENLHNCHEVTRPRGFQYFVTDATPVPRFDGPTLEQVRKLEQLLNEFYVAWRGGSGTRLFAYCQQRAWHDAAEWLFLVQHGAPFRREEAMENGEPTSVLYRPRKYAVLKYDTARGEMGVYCGAAREQRVLLRLFGRCLFGRPDFFPGGAKFDLGPLVELGRAALACEDVPGIEDVRLTEVEFYQRREPWRRTVQQAGDIFTLIEREEIRWPAQLEEITKATFTVKLWRQRRARRMTIVPCNRALYSRDEESWLLEKWMAARGIVQPVRN